MDTKHWTQSLDKSTQDFLEAFGSFTPEQLNWKPDPNTWSIAQNLDHLITINRTYFPVLDSLHEGTYKVPYHGKIGFVTSYLGKMILQGVGPDRKKKIQTFPIWEPSRSEINEDILQRFATHQEELKGYIQGSSNLLDQKVVISSPANKNIVYSLQSAFDIIVAHERRHLEQAKELGELLKQKA